MIWGEMRVWSWQGVREQGVSEAGAVPPAGNGFLAGFTVSVPGRQASLEELGKVKVGSCFSHLLLPSCPARRSRQCLRGGSKQSGRSCTSSSPGLSPSQTRCRDTQQVGRFSAGPVFRCPGPTWKPVSPESALGARAFEWLKSR